MTAEPDHTARRPLGSRLTDRLSMKTRRLIWVWSFLALPILFYSVIRFYPTIEAFWLSFTNWDLMSAPEFIGIANYQKLFAD
ncbi:MAG TPA: sugar ABC transporter permease, partial [Ochrobactrum sp.]|nr:sugar ABC transporter permease [Ochrobactrum sp.]